MNFLEARTCGNAQDAWPARAVVLLAVTTGRDVSSRAVSLEVDRVDLVERLRSRQPEIEAAVFARVRAVSGSEIEHAEYQLERLIATIAHEYRLEQELTERSPERHRAELVQRLLAGAPVDADELGYELDAWHLCVIATGANAEKAVRGLAAALGRELLPIAHDGELWAWLGGQRKLMIADVERVLSAQELAGVSLAIGEAARGIEGWRLTHREAKAAQLVARHRPPRGLTRYLGVALDATALQDEALADSLIERYLSPLDDMRIGTGATRRRMLRAYFKAEHNASSTAAALLSPATYSSCWLR
jgi:GGDEF-like domain